MYLAEATDGDVLEEVKADDGMEAVQLQEGGSVHHRNEHLVLHRNKVPQSTVRHLRVSWGIQHHNSHFTMRVV